MSSERFSGAVIHGGSSCLGVMTGSGPVISEGDGIGVFAIWDPDGDYGSAAMPLESDPRSAAARATREALRRAGRPGEAPELVWLTAAPGHEESVLSGIKDVVGRPALIVGASAADNDVSGGWSQLWSEGAVQDSVVVSVLFPSRPIACSFESGYAPTEMRGTVTRATGRVIEEIDCRPAAMVYEEWTGLKVLPEQGSASILAEASMFPLGRKSTVVEGIAFHLLAHPAVAHADGRLELFADVAEGEEICLMTGSQDSLVDRAGRIAEASRKKLPDGAVAGALMVYCGGCMLAVPGRMNEVARGVDEALDHAPFLVVFSFGEQGETMCGDSEHGNLMISFIAFAGDAPRVRPQAANAGE